MARLIDADALVELVKRHGCDKCPGGTLQCTFCTLSQFIAMIDSAPTIDAAPVRRGGCEYCNGSGRVPYQETHSVKLYLNSFGDARTIEVEADKCPPMIGCMLSKIPLRSAFIINFCPNCGADMRKEEHHEPED